MTPNRVQAMRVVLAGAALLLLAGPGPGRAQEPATVTVAEAVRLAMVHNEQVAGAAVAVEQARQRVREVRADGLPDLEASLDYTRNWLLPTIVFNDNTVKIGSDNEMQGALRLRQPLYTGGRVSGQVQAARGGVDASLQDQRQTRQIVHAGVETAIYDYLLAAEVDSLRRLALGRAESNARQVEALRRAGRATQFERMRARVQVADAAADAIEAANDLERAGIDLKDVVGLSLDTPIRVRSTFRRQTDLDLTRIEPLVTLALERRPEARRLNARQAGQTGDLRAARAGRRPVLDLVAVGQMQFQNDALDELSTGDEWRRSWSTGLSLQLPVFDGMRTRARVAQARASLKRLELDEERVRRGIEGEVRRAWMDVGAAGERLRARAGSVEQATQGLEDARSRYRTGAGTQLEVLEAQLSLQQAESEQARARRDRAVALVELERAVGLLGE